MKIDSMDATMYTSKPATTTTSAPEVKTSTQHVKSEGSEQRNVNKVAENADQLQKPLNQLTSNDLDGMQFSEKFLIQAIEKANKEVLGRNTTFRFSIHEATKRISVTVLDKDTDEVIREIPPEKVLDVVAQMWEMAGLFVDERR